MGWKRCSGQCFSCMYTERTSSERRVFDAHARHLLVPRSRISAGAHDAAVRDGHPRWEALRHWKGDTLESLVGVAYKPSTLDKVLRELKYADVSATLVEAGAAF